MKKRKWISPFSTVRLTDRQRDRVARYLRRYRKSKRFGAVCGAAMSRSLKRIVDGEAELVKKANTMEEWQYERQLDRLYGRERNRYVADVNRWILTKK